MALDMKNLEFAFNLGKEHMIDKIFTKGMLSELVSQVEIWGKDRKITTNGNPMTQAIKTLEETHELLEAINRNDQNEIRDAIGDIIVTLIMQCKLQEITLEECLFSAFQEIKDRKGELNEVGDFIKLDSFDSLPG